MNLMLMPVILVGIVLFLTVHHAFTHDGQGFDPTDFKNAVSSLMSSHEGLILLAVIALTAIMIGGKFF